MKTQKLSPDSYLFKMYKSEIDLLPVNYQIYHSIDSKKDELIIHKRDYKVLPKIKGTAGRGNEVKLILSDAAIERIKITVPYSIKTVTISIDCTKFQNDSIAYDVERKVYEPQIKQFISEHLTRIKLQYNVKN
jgi:hypothetical protein